ncbi:2-hydroxyacid dehydrogenase [Blastococcus saxobsidens]|uniref:D-isomer specific 2-hydroxyacid dehydrogenase NAD-binding n=1 Tax=Blastococcus saxobsidens (strain DD2) TaxID=1146883 RepID=H6RN74_BLASD|nr:2-hydroxyacid dehydrogenase [Blastococcus saxobsidens]CCG02622.1 D-isomer specific 2-hydroxyacid dehydrogenase NAD-binding [Blastococcus saxobsidens DD2]
MSDSLNNSAVRPPSERSSGRVLIVGQLPDALVDTLRQRFGAVVLPDPADKFLDHRRDDVEVVFTRAMVGVGPDLLAALPNLVAIVHLGVGYDATDVAGAIVRGIGVSNTPDVLTDCVADVAVGGLIDVMRQLTAADRFVRRGDWLRGRYPLTKKVSGSRVGIFGLGRIGGAVARRLEGFDAVISYHSRRQVPGVPYGYASSVLELAASNDALIVTAAAGPDSNGIVDAAVLDALGPAGFVVNVARGSIIDESALVEALKSQRIAGAALDVLGSEPNVPAELLDMDNVVLLPHLGSGTRETMAAMTELAIANVEQALENRTLVTPVPGAELRR